MQMEIVLKIVIDDGKGASRPPAEYRLQGKSLK